MPWHPRCPPPPPLVVPTRIDPTGEAGPTRGQSRSRAWRRVGRGLVVPAATPRTIEQRICEVAHRLPAGAAVTGWAALRLAGANYFDGEGERGGVLPVPVLLPHHARRLAPEFRVERTRGEMPTVVARHGVPCVPSAVALCHELAHARTQRLAGVMVDMALAAGVVALEDVRRTVGEMRAVPPGSLYAVSRACAQCRSPKESEMLQVWERLAGLPRPLMNREVRDLEGRLLAVVDLLDVPAGVGGEYDGADHRHRRQHSRDESRHARLRDVGIETFTIVAGDSDAVQVERMHAARRRALWLPEERRRWRVGAFVPAPPLAEEVAAQGQPFGSPIRGWGTKRPERWLTHRTPGESGGVAPRR